jgi:hypothetical protein
MAAARLRARHGLRRWPALGLLMHQPSTDDVWLVAWILSSLACSPASELVKPLPQHVDMFQ